MICGDHKRTMATDCPVRSKAESTTWQIRQTATKFKRCCQWNPLDFANRRPRGRICRNGILAKKHLPSTFPAVDKIGSLCQEIHGISQEQTVERKRIPSIMKKFFLFFRNSKNF